MRVAVGQFAASEDVDANISVIGDLAARAADEGADLLALPEYSSFPASTTTEQVATHAEPLDGPFATAVRDLARQHGLALAVGMAERLQSGPKVHNTVLVIDSYGELVAAYRKVHLYDALGVTESDWIEPGEPGRAATIDVGGLTVGVQTCYDLRFPESTRVLADAGADVVLVPAQWVPGPLKEDHWSTLLRARAIENTVYVAGAGQSRPTGAGGSTIVDPMGVVVTGLGDRTGIAVATVDQDRIAQVRAGLPVLAGRRYRVEPIEADRR
jgi:predicted amidohydrolase